MAWALSRVLAGAAFMATAILSVSLAGAADDWKTCAEAPDDVAIAACTRAIASGTYEGRDLSRLHNSRGIAWHDKGDLDRAIADYSEAIRLNPKLATAYYNRGIAWRAKGDLDRAIADYSEAIRLDPKLAAAYNNRGNAWSDKGDLDGAIADYSEAIRLNPKYTIAYRNRGLANLYAGTPPKALADLAQAHGLDPKNAYTALWLDIAGNRSNLASRLPQA